MWAVIRAEARRERPRQWPSVAVRRSRMESTYEAGARAATEWKHADQGKKREQATRDEIAADFWPHHARRAGGSGQADARACAHRRQQATVARGGDAEAVGLHQEA